MLVRFERGKRNGVVQAMGRGNVYHVDVGVSDELMIIGVDLRAMHLSAAAHSILVYVAHRGDLGAFAHLIIASLVQHRDATQSYHPHANWSVSHDLGSFADNEAAQSLSKMWQCMKKE